MNFLSVCFWCAVRSQWGEGGDKAAAEKDSRWSKWCNRFLHARIRTFDRHAFVIQTVMFGSGSRCLRYFSAFGFCEMGHSARNVTVTAQIKGTEKPISVRQRTLKHNEVLPRTLKVYQDSMRRLLAFLSLRSVCFSVSMTERQLDTHCAA